MLWGFHAIHHSSKTVDWLSSVRLHPVNDVVSRVLQVLPLYWIGFNAGVLAGFVPFLTLYALLLHANVNWTYGRLRFVIASPTFHRWHHTSEEEASTRTSPACSLSSIWRAARSTCHQTASPSASAS